jgi:ABC-type branched-subunit amino acid transport system ATPase component
MYTLARGLISMPKMIMLDESSMGLTPELVDEIYEKIKVLREVFGLTVQIIRLNRKQVMLWNWQRELMSLKMVRLKCMEWQKNLEQESISGNFS